MVVCKRAVIDASRGDAINVLGVHPIVNLLSPPELITLSYAGFQVYEPQVWRSPLELLQGSTPNVREANRLRDDAVCFFSKPHVFFGVLDVGFVKRGFG